LSDGGGRSTNLSSPPLIHTLASDREQNTLDSLPSQNGPDSLQLLRDQMSRVNRDQTVWNADRFPELAPDGVVLIVQVHRRDGYLRQLFKSMREVRGIEKVLLVISHDYYYDDMMRLVQTVDFCRVTQIFYPFSLQVYPDTFPGTSKNDCPRDSTKEEAEAMNCTNAEHPDSYGHYREAKITAVKHHWWWKVNMVFDGMQATRDFTGYVVFLEEDHYLSPDFLYMTERLIAMKEEKCAECDFINLGMYTAVKSASTLAHRVSVGIWNAGKNNMGFGMNRKTWEQIKSCKELFCSYDDYNWDWSLNSLGQSCLQRHLKVLVAKAPRIFHIGNCGVHHTKVCNEEKDAEKIIRKLEALKGSLFPESLQLDQGLNPSAARKKVKPYGGWGDVRDRKLCLSFVNNALRDTL
jgi:alpha-1,6-mannosyl-glycoprotein beta-1,2-N-acetylglucosaminyltransferase